MDMLEIPQELREISYPNNTARIAGIE